MITDSEEKGNLGTGRETEGTTEIEGTVVVVREGIGRSINTFLQNTGVEMLPTEDTLRITVVMLMT